jgi:TonB family protein
MEKPMRIATLLAFCLLMASPFTHAQTIQPATPIDRPMGDYPDSAGTAEGTVKLHFTIGKDGHVKDVTPVDSNPPGLFEAAAAAAISQWTYRPRTVDGVAVDQPDNAILMRFKPTLAPTPVWLNPEPPLYPRKAYDEKIEGWVKVAFDLSPLGMTGNVRVLESSAPGVFDKQAMEDVNDRVFQTPVVDGVRQPLKNVTAMINFSLKNARVAPMPVHKVMPNYPEDAEYRGIIGFCATEFTIEPDGSVSNIKVTQSSPKGEFEKVTIDALKRWTFEPPVGPVSDRSHFMFRYLFADVPQSRMHYMKPGQWVSLEYTLSTAGRATDIKLVDKSDSDVDAGKAADQLRKMGFAPVVENGVPVEKQHLRIRITGPETK